MTNEGAGQKRGDSQELIKTPVLTLKNLYRMLTMRDFPMLSYAVFPRQTVAGLTLLSFWQRVLTEGLPEGTDLSFFKTEGGYSRTLSRLMNRTGSPGMMKSWFEELSAQMNPALLLRMTDCWVRHLTRMRYASEVLDERLRFFLREALRTRDSVSEDAEPLLRSLLSLIQENRKAKSEIPQIFRQSVILSWLTFFALYGTRPRDPALIRLSMSPEAEIGTLYTRQRKMGETGADRRIMTLQGMAPNRPLTAESFFGRQEELREAGRLLAQGGKLAVTGIGGIGKTELTRQLMAMVRNQYEQIACVSYQNSLEGSFAAAFPELKGVRPGDILGRAKELLGRNRTGKALLLLDNVDNTAETDPALDMLEGFGCDVLLTSRLAAPKGFTSLNLQGLGPEDSRKLFLLNDPGAKEQIADVDTLCAAAAGHPLAIQLFARLCRTRYMSVDSLVCRLKEEGVRPLSYIQQASSLRLADEFRKLFDADELSGPQRKLMTLLALLPVRGWRPDELLKYAGDVCPEEYALGDLCQILSDLGWLLRSETGYAIHPIIAETVRLQSTSADSFPKLWGMIFEETERMDTLLQLVLISLIQRTAVLNGQAIQCLVRMEHRIGFLPYTVIPDSVYEIHWKWIEKLEAAGSHHEKNDHIWDSVSSEARDTAAYDFGKRDRNTDTNSKMSYLVWKVKSDYYLGQGMRDIVLLSRRDRLMSYIRQIDLQDAAWMRAPGRLQCLYTLLEYASTGADAEEAGRVFRTLQPEEEDAAKRAEYLIAYSVWQRQAAHDIPSALASLREARELLEGQIPQAVSARESNLSYRMATCMLDLDRKEEAREELEQCLGILRKLGYAEDTPDMMSTRSTYAVCLTFLGDYGSALTEYETLGRQYRAQGREKTGEYAMMRNNTALALMEVGRGAEAEKMIREVLEIDRELGLTPTYVATHMRNAAMILSRNGKGKQALRMANQACEEREKHFGADSPWTADAMAVKALALHCAGRTEEARALIGPACQRMEAVWGQEHRHTINAKKIKEILNF